MKSSTLIRSNLSKEKMAVLEALSDYKQEVHTSEAPNVYVRPNKEHELDVLWQNFRNGQKNEKSPSVYLVTGFIAGVSSVLLIMGLVGFFGHNNSSAPNQSATSTTVADTVKTDKPAASKLNFLGNHKEKTEETADTVSAKADETYTIKSGDTMSSILIHFYGKASKENEIKVLNANKMTNPNKLSIGQVLKIPMGE